MDKRAGEHSPALLDAQRKVEFLRLQQRTNRSEGTSAPDKTRPIKEMGGPIREMGTEGAPAPSEPALDVAIPQLPDHLGWGSPALTAAVRAAQGRGTVRQTKQKGFWQAPLAPEIIPVPDFGRETAGRQKNLIQATARSAETVKLYPDIALGMLRKRQVAAGRVWLLLQFIDSAGCGWVPVATARDRLTDEESSLRVCGRRQFRNLLARGEGLFWQRSKDRIWLRSAAKVAASLVVCRLPHQPVSLPVSSLLQGVGVVRAHFYASFHSSRVGKDGKKQTSGPISRDTLQRLSRVSRRTLRTYDKRAGVRTQRNFAIGAKLTIEERQKRAWKHGCAVFRFTDRDGRLGQKNDVYTAWQLPNDYCGPHELQPRGRQKRCNRELADLFMKGMTGNGKRSADGSSGKRRRFHDSGLSAAVGYNRAPEEDMYWRSRLGKRTYYGLWFLLPGQEES